MTENITTRKVPDSIYDAMMAMLAPYAELERADLVAAIEEAMDPFGPLEMIDAAEVCAILHCARSTLWRLTRDHALTAYRSGKKTILYKRSEVIRLIKNGEDKSYRNG